MDFTFRQHGEITLSEHVEACGRKVRGGQQIRLIDIPADAGHGKGVFESVPEDLAPAEFADMLTNASRKFYGSAIRAFISGIIREKEASLKAVEEVMSTFRTDYLPEGAAPEVVRGLGRFALIAAAGELAASRGITGWRVGEATNAAATCFKAWLGSRGTAGSSDEYMAVRQVIEFIERHTASRFDRECDDYTRIIANRAGYIRRNADTGQLEYLFLPEVFRKELCKSFDCNMVLQALQEARLLVVQKGRNLTVRRRVDGSPTSRFYCVSIPDEWEQEKQ